MRFSKTKEAYPQLGTIPFKVHSFLSLHINVLYHRAALMSAKPYQKP